MVRLPPKSLVLDLLGTMPSATAMPIAALIEAAGMFGIDANAVRVAVARLVSAGQLVRDERGRYCLGEEAIPVGRRVRSWRDLARRTRAWRGEWIGVVPARVERAAQRRRVRALRLLGLAQLDDGVWVQPDNLVERIDGVRSELRALGLPAADVVVGLHDLDAATERRAHGLWNVQAMRQGYRRSSADLAASAERLEGVPAERAMVESFLLGGRVIRELVLDPLLPDEICPSDERRALVEQLRAYDRIGRLAWAALMERWGLPAHRAPVDARTAHAPARAAAG